MSVWNLSWIWQNFIHQSHISYATLACRATTRQSTASLHDTSAAEAAIEVAEAAESDLPLQRRNSIHNVPYVDVNDPETRARMERYKEERRDDDIQ